MTEKLSKAFKKSFQDSKKLSVLSQPVKTFPTSAIWPTSPVFRIRMNRAESTVGMTNEVASLFLDGAHLSLLAEL